MGRDSDESTSGKKEGTRVGAILKKVLGHHFPFFKGKPYGASN